MESLPMLLLMLRSVKLLVAKSLKAPTWRTLVTSNNDSKLGSPLSVLQSVARLLLIGDQISDLEWVQTSSLDALKRLSVYPRFCARKFCTAESRPWCTMHRGECCRLGNTNSVGILKWPTRPSTCSTYILRVLMNIQKFLCFLLLSNIKTMPSNVYN